MKNSTFVKYVLLGAVIGITFSVFVTNTGYVPLLRTPSVSAQATTTKTDLISLYRANANAFLTWKDSNKALRAQYDALAYSWVDGDFTSSNAGITASAFTSAVTNLSLVQAAFDSGGTLSSGFPTTIYKIK